MKKLTAISLLIFWTGFVALATTAVVNRQNNKNNSELSTATTSINTSTITEQQELSGITASQTIVLSTSEIAKHNRANNCWILVSGKVYNVTGSINSHPGGANEIVKFCGADATAAFQTKDGRGNNHSTTAYAMLANYFVGNLNQILSTGKNSPAKPTQAVNTQPTIKNSEALNSNPPSTSQPVATIPASAVPLTITEIAKHNSANNCWLLINNKVYNVTSYINSHPGGANEIIKFCGTDATSAFQTKDGRGNNHSSAAYAMLSSYYIGDLNQNISQQQLNTTLQNTNSTAPPRSGDDDEYDD